MSRTAWEYEVYTQPDMDEIPNLLANLGREGWELVAVTPETTNSLKCFYFKRSLNIPEEKPKPIIRRGEGPSSWGGMP